jgi:hypothetical protein
MSLSSLYQTVAAHHKNRDPVACAIFLQLRDIKKWEAPAYQLLRMLQLTMWGMPVAHLRDCWNMWKVGEEQADTDQFPSLIEKLAGRGLLSENTAHIKVRSAV